MCVPGLLIRKVAVRMLGQASHHMRSQGAFAHVGERLGIDDVIVVAGAQQFQEIEAALGGGGAEPGEMRVADLRAEAIGGFVARAGVVDRDPCGTRKPGTQHLARLGEETALTLDQQADHLALGDEDAEATQQGHQSRHRHLPLMILSKHEATQFRPEVTLDADRQRRRHYAAIRRLPPLAAEVHGMRTDHQILHHEARVALEAGAARRRRHFDRPFLMDRKLRPRAASRTLLVAAAPRRLRLGPSFHAARLEVRSRRPALKPRNLVPQRRYHSLQLDHLLPLLDNQALQLGVRQAVQIIGRRHAQNKSDSHPPVNRIIIPPRVLPLLRSKPVRLRKSINFPGYPQSTDIGRRGWQIFPAKAAAAPSAHTRP